MTVIRVEKMFNVGSFHFRTNTHRKMMLPHASYYSLLLLISFLSDRKLSLYSYVKSGVMSKKLC